MKYRAVIMAPKIIEFENPGSAVHVKNQATASADNEPKVVIDDMVYEAKLMGCYPVEAEKPQPLIFDPPPMVA